MSASIIRTIVPIIVGALLGWALKVGLDLPSGAVSQIVTVVVTAAYYAIARLLEQKWPEVGRWLLAAGLTARKPVYVKELGTARMYPALSPNCIPLQRDGPRSFGSEGHFVLSGVSAGRPAYGSGCPTR